MILGIVLLICLYILWKMFVDGWLFKAILFFAGWIGVYVVCAAYMNDGHRTAVTVGTGAGAHQYNWAFVIATSICVLCLLCTKVKND